MELTRDVGTVLAHEAVISMKEAILQVTLDVRTFTRCYCYGGSFDRDQRRSLVTVSTCIIQ